GTAAASAKAVSMIVFPAEDIVANSIKVIMTVDGVEYTTMVPAPESGSWLAGINYLYTAKLSGTDLVISSNNILLTDWNSITVSGELALQ
ncbi:fimbrillin family protein, partial [Parabacteroides distasonis]